MTPEDKSVRSCSTGALRLDFDEIHACRSARSSLVFRHGSEYQAGPLVPLWSLIIHPHLVLSCASASATRMNRSRAPPLRAVIESTDRTTASELISPRPSFSKPSRRPSVQFFTRERSPNPRASFRCGNACTVQLVTGRPSGRPANQRHCR
jgi:hypothetical protein